MIIQLLFLSFIILQSSSQVNDVYCYGQLQWNSGQHGSLYRCEVISELFVSQIHCSHNALVILNKCGKLYTVNVPASTEVSDCYFICVSMYVLYVFLCMYIYVAHYFRFKKSYLNTQQLT